MLFKQIPVFLKLSQDLFIALLAHTDHRRAYKRKFDAGSLEREPREFWHGIRARLDGLSRETCPYRFEKAESWYRGFDGNRQSGCKPIHEAKASWKQRN